MNLFRRGISWLVRAVRKLFLDRVRYATSSGYRAEAYWSDRFRRHGDSLKGPGHEGLSESENHRLYSEARAVLEQRLANVGVLVPASRVLEIGPGTGIWTQMCADAGVVEYSAIDITSERFAALRSRFPGYRFQQLDATHEVPSGPFDLILCLDVIEHVVSEDRLRAMLGGMVASLERDGVLVLSYPPWKPGRVNLYYLRFWAQAMVQGFLEPLSLDTSEDFRVGILQIYRRHHV